MLGAVSQGFFEWTNGPGSGGGVNAPVDDWELPQGKYGTAQLSPYVIWPLDGLNLAPGHNGELFGYGYTPLPFIEQQNSSLGFDVTTGSQAWTLFLNTANFKGPLAFVIPNFFSKPAIEDDALQNMFLDSLPADPIGSFGIENHYIPAVHQKDNNGVSYAKIMPTLFPATGENRSRIFSDLRVFSRQAMWQKVAEWFDGGQVASTNFETGGTFSKDIAGTEVGGLIEAESFEEFVIIAEQGEAITDTQNGVGEEEFIIDWDQFAQRVTDDPRYFEYRWTSPLVEEVDGHYKIPEYYQLVEDSKRGMVWKAIAPESVPSALKLVEYQFPNHPRNDQQAITTPQDKNSPWQSPGPTAGPFQKVLTDGSIITYYWYRFIDQPSIRYWNFSEEILQKLQARVTLIHQSWGNDDEYFASPVVGSLASIDPALIVEPPPGLAHGFVPIVTRQELFVADDVIFANNFEND